MTRSTNAAGNVDGQAAARRAQRQSFNFAGGDGTALGSVLGQRESPAG